MDQGADQLQFLPHAAGEVAGLPLAEGPHVGKVQQVLEARDAVFAADAVKVGVKIDVFIHRQIRIKPETLAHIGQMVLDGTALGRQLASRHPGTAAGRVQQAGQHPQRGGLAGSVRSHQSVDLSAAYGQGDVRHGRMGTEGFGQTVDADGHVIETRRHDSTSMTASAGMPGFNTPSGLASWILMR